MPFVCKSKLRTENGNISSYLPTILEKWENDFSTLLNPSNVEDVDNHIPESDRMHPVSDQEMNGLFTYNELKKQLRMQNVIKPQVLMKSWLMC